MTRKMKAPLRLTTARLVLHKPVLADAEAILERYASDRDALAYMSWPAHASLADTRAFLELSDAEWKKLPAGPYLVSAGADERRLSGTGFAFESPESAATGYVLARDSWGQGFATEALRAIVALAASLGVRRLTAACHAKHRASAHVLEKAGFTLESTLRRRHVFPNLGPEPQDVLTYSMNPAAASVRGTGA